VVPELIQSNANGYEVGWWLEEALSKEEKRAALSEELRKAASKLGKPGVHRRAAHELALLLSK